MSLKNLSDYPNGFANGVSMRGLPLLDAFAGNIYWVNSANGGNGGKGTRKSPFATLDYAIGRCTANQGDIILVAPNHAETITGAGGITVDVAGVSIVGLGAGNQRPRFLMDGGTAVTCLVSAADVSMSNLVFAGGHNGIVTCFDVTGINASFRGIELEDNTTDEHFLVGWKASGAAGTANGLSVEGCRWVSIDAGITDFISLIDDISGLTVKDNFMCTDAATGAGLVLCATGKDILGLAMERNVCIWGNTAGDLLIDNDTAVNTGYAAYNLCGCHDTAGVVLFDCDGIRLFENRVAGIDTLSGYVMPAADTDT